MKVGFQVTEDTDSVSFRATLTVSEPLRVSEVTIRIPLSSRFDLYAINRSRNNILPWQSGVIWCGVPEDTMIHLESSEQSIPPLRITSDGESCFYDWRLRVSSEYRENSMILDMVRFGSDRQDILLQPGTYELAVIRIDSSPAMPPIMKYPKTLFSSGEIKRIYTVGCESQAANDQVLMRIKDRFPQYWDKERMTGVSIIPISLPARPGKLIELAREVRANRNESIVLRIQRDLWAGFGYRFNLFALMGRTMFKMKSDLAGNTLFIPNRPRSFLLQRLDLLKQTPKKWFRFLIKGAFMIVWMLMLPLMHYRVTHLGRRQ